MKISELMSIRTVSDAFYSAQYLNMLLMRYMKTLDIGGGQNKIPVWAFLRGARNLPALKILCGTILPSIIPMSHIVFHNK